MKKGKPADKPKAKPAVAWPPIPDFYYGGRAGYAMSSPAGFIPLPNEGQVKAHLLHHGVVKADLDFRLCTIREENYVAHIGPVAGFPPGLHKSEDSGENFLVTRGPNIIEGVPGEWEFIWEFFREMLDDPKHPEQILAFFSWLRQARLNLTQRVRRPLPALVMVGPRECGKTLAIEITRQILGGRAAPALRALNGTTPFNADIVGAELLTVDDEIASRDHRARVGLAQGIKLQLFATSVRVEAKGRDALSMRPVQALMIAVNSEPEHLHVLPHLDDSLRDKISLFHCQKAKLGGLGSREEIARSIAAELPAFIEYLEAFEIPADLANARTGAAAWQHPKVVELLAIISPEERLRELLQQCFAITEKIKTTGCFEGTAAEIGKLLNGDDATRHGARSLISWDGATGTLLSRLAASGRASIASRTLHGQKLWKITNLTASGVEG